MTGEKKCEELANFGLGNIIESIKAQVKAFQLFRGKNEQLDVLLQNITLILKKQNLLDLTDNDKSGSNSINNGTSSSFYTCQDSGSFIGDDESTQQHQGRLLTALNQIKLQESAFKFFATEDSCLNLFLQNLGAIMARLPKEITSMSCNDQLMDLTKRDQQCMTIEQEGETSQSQVTEFSVLLRKDCNPDESFTAFAENVHQKNQTCSNSQQDENSSNNKCSCSTTSSGAIKRKLCCFATASSSNSSASKKHKEEAEAKENLSRDDNIQRQSDESPSALQKMMATDLVMMKIMNYLTISELKSCREVNWRFNICAHQALLHREEYQVKFDYDWNHKKYFLSQSSTFVVNNPSLFCRDNLTLHSYTAFLKACHIFPCESFIFSGGTLESKELRNFFCFYGKHVKRLQLDLYCPPLFQLGDAANSNKLSYPSIYSLKTLLVCRIPFVESLELHSFPQQWKNAYVRLFPEPKGCSIELKHLKSLTIGRDCPPRIFSDLLKACVNLQRVDPAQDFGSILSANKFHLIRNLMWRPSIENMEQFEQQFRGLEHNASINEPYTSRIIRKYFPLEYFGICLDKIPPEPDFLSRVSRVMMQLLKASSKTLSEFCIASSLGAMTNLRIPVLPKVKTVKVGKFDLPTSAKYPQLFGQSEVYFPPEFQFVSSFPNLTTVRFHFYDLSTIVPWEDCFGYGRLEPVLSVTCVALENSKFLPIGWLTKITKLFPNVEDLEIKATRFRFVESARILWGLKRLKDLKFKINFNIVENTFPMLDAAFTGFSRDTCLNLVESSDQVDLETVNCLREYPSIVDRKNELRSMQITFVDLNPKTVLEYPPLMTHVTSLFAFQMCPKLQIVFHFKVKNKANVKKLRHAVSPILYKYTNVT